ncbi:hypothetical protein JB92DRAFT_3094664 [Gautieria morchelliformis]|nr:hypothetical protein JB92DRAFT_3094664 [Gautieria morchelliformis]
MSSEDSRSQDTDAAKASRYVEQVRHDFGDSWRQDDKFLDKFFPIPKDASTLYAPLRRLMNDILAAEKQSRQQPSASSKALGQTGKRTCVLATHAKKKKVQSSHARRPNLPVSPTLFLAGAGANVVGVTWTVIKPITQAGISPMEVILDSDDFLAARDRLAANMTQIMSDQTNRRFAYGLILTETTCTVYMFDHSGAVAAPPFNYHQHPAQFCAVLFGLPTVASVSALTRPSSRVQRTFMFVLYLVGRGTTTLRTLKLGDLNSTFVVKDAWIPRGELAGRESEGSLLRHARAKGVVQLEHFEDIRRSNDPNDLDTILRNRKIDQPTAEELKLERVHTRIVLKPFAETIDQFETRKDLLLAFHDAVLAHQQLHDVAGILHRDISIGNILLNPRGAEDNRGILIDFDHAIRVGDTSPYLTKRQIGTWRFMSRNALDGKRPHTYIDDLEAFYFVLCWILMVYSGPHKVKAVPKQAAWWDLPDAFVMKEGHFGIREFRLPVDRWFGPCFKTLASRLFDFFRVRGPIGRLIVHPDDPKRDYDKYLGHTMHH